ncbi:MAG: outer membrane lipid asymmetry maintenance protein MlaD [Deltaproteobacteria bacterium]|nr:outer membrane lipid asymmetry maintenance protein MlaD [Deltaproteobacteria bacterium]
MKKYSMETTVGIFVAICLVSVAYLTLKLGDVSILGDNSYPLFAKFTSVSGLKVGSPVEMVGMQIGRVAGFTMDQKDQVAVVELRIGKGIKIYDDAMASIKSNGLLGDKYVKIDAGGAGGLLEPGGTITETEPPVDILELISKYAFGDVEKQQSPKQNKGDKQ